MAHEIDFSKGFAAFTAVGKPAWHGLGQVVNSLTPQEALEKGGLDFFVEKSPNIHSYPGTAFPDIMSADSFFTWRTDTGAILGDKLGAYYTPLQNAAAFDILSPLCDMGLKIETAGAIFGGRTVFVLLDMGTYKVAGVDPVKNYLLYSNSHDGSKTVTGYFTDVRVVCANTLAASAIGAAKVVKVRHTTNVEALTKQALEWMLAAEEHQDKANEVFTKMVETKFTEQRFVEYVTSVFFSTKEREKIQQGGVMDAISTRKKNQLQAFMDYAAYGPGQAEYKGTAWGAYNAVSGYLGNVADYKNDDTRMTSLLWGNASYMNEQALVLAAEPERIQKTGLSPDFFLN
jgi:phage/plasmid-like protein (TIGR03299 family)